MLPYQHANVFFFPGFHAYVVSQQMLNNRVKPFPTFIFQKDFWGFVFLHITCNLLVWDHFKSFLFFYLGAYKMRTSEFFGLCCRATSASICFCSRSDKMQKEVTQLCTRQLQCLFLQHSSSRRVWTQGTHCTHCLQQQPRWYEGPGERDNG